MRVVHFSCFRPYWQDGTAATGETLFPPTTFGQAVVGLNPTKLIAGGDTPYADLPCNSPLTGIQPPAGEFETLTATEVSTSTYWMKVLGMWDHPAVSPMLSIPSINWLFDEHDTMDNDYVHSVSSTKTTGYGTFATTQEEANAKHAVFMAAYKGVTKTTAFQNWYEATFPAHAASVAGYDFSHINNPVNNDAGVAGLVPPWVMGTVKDPDGNSYDNTDYADFANRPSAVLAGAEWDAWVDAHHPPLYWREGWTYAGVRDDATPDIEFFFLDSINHRDRTEEWEAMAPTHPAYPRDLASAFPDRVRATFGATQITWLKTRLAASTATWKVLVIGKMLFQMGASLDRQPTNADGFKNYTVEVTDLMQWIATNITQNLIIIGGDCHFPHIINFQPGDSHQGVTFPNGISNICSAPAHSVIFPGFFDSPNVVWSRRCNVFTSIDITPEQATVTMYEISYPNNGYSSDGCRPAVIATMLAGDMHFSSVKDPSGNNAVNMSSIGFV